MNINCLIVDDEPLARNLLTEYVKKVPYLNLMGTCPNAIAAMEVLREKPIDLLFLDIQMPELTGINMLRALQHQPLVILTTAYSQYALESYDHDVVDYLLKPITMERFLRAVDKASQRLTEGTIAPQAATSPAPEFVFVKDGTKLVKVKFDDILFVEGLKDYVVIQTRQQKIVSLQRLKAMEEQLPADKFIRVHNSFIIAFQAIDAVLKSEIQIGAKRIPISDSYRKAFKDFLDKNKLA